MISSVFSGFGRFILSVTQKSLEVVDGIQDKVEKLDSNNAPKKEFDQKQLAVINNVSTYIDEPSDPSYKKYEETFNVDDYKAEIELIKENSIVLNRNYEKLVPDIMNDKVFWCRVFYKVELNEKRENERDELIKKLENDNNDDELTEEELKVLENICSDEDWGDWN